MGFAELIVAVIAFVLAAAVVRAYQRSRDALHPMIFMAPMMFYMYVFRPAVLLERGELQRFFSESQLTLAMAVKLVSCIMFCAGCLHRAGQVTPRRKGMEVVLTPQGRMNVYLLGCLMGLVALGANLYMVSISGGFFEVYSTPYGGLQAPSGYFSTLTFLCWPAVVFLAMSRQRLQLRLQDLVLVALFLGPMLLEGVLGARRFTVFCALTILFCCWYIFSDRRPSLWRVLFTVTALGVIMLGLVIYRSQIYLGSRFDFDSRAFTDQVLEPKDVGPQDEVVLSTGLILTVAECGHSDWGKSWLATIFVRPIPREWWPTKYEDLGCWQWGHEPWLFGYSRSEWIQAVGFAPPTGSGTGFDATLFADFSWAGPIACYLFGRFFAWVWYKERHVKGLWQLLFVMLLVTSVHAPTQGALTTLVVWALGAVPTALLWRFFVVHHAVPQRMTRYMPLARD